MNTQNHTVKTTKNSSMKLFIKRCQMVMVLLLTMTFGYFVINQVELHQGGLFTRLEKVSTQTIQKNEWNLILVNHENKIPKRFELNLLQLSDGSFIDERIYNDLQAMFDEARQLGLEPVINSAYRTEAEQGNIYINKIEAYTCEGYSKQEATKLASNWVALPSYSEHQTGLALDIIGANGTGDAIQGWLMENSYKYGFILRYPSGKEHITKIKYEPWHYRYVGKDVAKEIYDQQLTLEEYLN